MSQPPDEIIEANRRLRQHRAEAPAPQRLATVIELPTLPDSYFAEAERAHAAEAAKADRELREERARWRRDMLRMERVPLRPPVRAQLLSGRLGSTEALESAKAWRAAVKGGSRDTTWVAIGPCGTGKTVAGARLMCAFGRSKYVKAQRLIGLHRAMFGPQFEAYEALIDARFVFVDEVGDCEDAGREKQAITDLVDARIGRPTMLAGNLRDADALAARFGNRFVSRMHEVGRIEVFAGDDLRRSR